jgi:hypothetical protein
MTFDRLLLLGIVVLLLNAYVDGVNMHTTLYDIAYRRQSVMCANVKGWGQ